MNVKWLPLVLGLSACAVNPKSIVLVESQSDWYYSQDSVHLLFKRSQLTSTLPVGSHMHKTSYQRKQLVLVTALLDTDLSAIKSSVSELALDSTGVFDIDTQRQRWFDKEKLLQPHCETFIAERAVVAKSQLASFCGLTVKIVGIPDGRLNASIDLPFIRPFLPNKRINMGFETPGDWFNISLLSNNQLIIYSYKNFRQIALKEFYLVATGTGVVTPVSFDIPVDFELMAIKKVADKFQLLVRDPHFDSLGRQKIYLSDLQGNKTHIADNIDGRFLWLPEKSWLLTKQESLDDSGNRTVVTITKNDYRLNQISNFTFSIDHDMN